MKKRCWLMVFIVLLGLTSRLSFSQSLLHPNEYFNLTLGADRTLVNYEQVCDYFDHLSQHSPRLQIENLGVTTEGRPFLLAIISSEKNMRQLGELLRVQQALADPRRVKQEELSSLLHQGRAIVSVNCSIHSTEIGATQMAPLLAYALATDTSRSVREILDDVILLLLPCQNPDGMNNVIDWYMRNLGTQYETAPLPWLYHTYAGHDINRDWYMLSLQETRLTVEKIYNVWHPVITLDMHQMGGNGPRLFVPPFVDPIDPNVDPILVSEINMLGTTIAAELTAQGKSGVITHHGFDAWSPSRTYSHYHAGIRILSEVASCYVATPIEPISERHPSRIMKPSWNLPLPWNGSAWRLSDIINYDWDVVLSVLTHAARYRENWLRSFYQVGVNALSDTSCVAYVIPDNQRDPALTWELLRVLERGQVEIHRAETAFQADGRTYDAGSYIVYNAQPYGAFVRTLLDVQHYSWEENSQAYDIVGHTIPLAMGVSVDRIARPFDVPVSAVDTCQLAEGVVVDPSAKLFFCENRSTYTARAMNQLLKKGVPVFWSTEPVQLDGRIFPQGSIVVETNRDETVLLPLGRELGLSFYGVRPRKEALPLQRIRPFTVGVYRSWTATIDEGWLRFVLEEYGFNFKPLFDEDIRAGKLGRTCHAIIFSDMTEDGIVHGNRPERMPERYCGGIGDVGIQNLKSFVQEGGTLVLVGDAALFGLNHFDVPVTEFQASQVKGFRVGGSILKMNLDTSSPICYGMPAQVAVLFQQRNPLFEAAPSRIVGQFPDRDLLLSGGLLGEETIADRAAIAHVPYGKGQLILFGFRPYFRAQTRGTYKLLFNSLFLSSVKK